MTRRTSSLSVLVVAVLGAAACKDPPPPPAPTPELDAAPAAPASAQVDLATCAGCSLAPTPNWTFEGIFSDATCTVPLAQVTIAACAAVPALGATQLTYVDDVGQRKANEVASVTLSDAPSSPRFRAVGKKCVRANEGAVDLTPTGCSGGKACRDTNGGLVCSGCRTFANGCPDYEETRLYAAITDPGLKVAGGTGNGNMARLTACCNVLNSEANRLGLSPEAGLLRGAAAQCAALVKQTAPNGTAPEAGLLRGLLAGRSVPAACAGF